MAYGFDPRITYTTAPGEDGEEDPATLSLVWFAVAKAQNNQLARYFMAQGAKASAMFAAAWWGNADIIEELVKHGDDVNNFVGATPFHMAIDVLYRGVEGKPELAKSRLKTVKEMLRLGANPNIAAFNKTTPLHSVLEKDYDVEVFKLLAETRRRTPTCRARTAEPFARSRHGRRDRRYFKAARTFTRAWRLIRCADAGSPVRGPDASLQSGVHARRHDLPGTGDRRQHDDLQRGGWHAGPAAAAF